MSQGKGYGLSVQSLSSGGCKCCSVAVIGCDDRVDCCTATIQLRCLKIYVLLNLVWEQPRSSVLLFCSLAFIFRWSIAVLAQRMLICEDNKSIYTHIKLWAEVQIEAVLLGKQQQCCFLFDCCGK